MHHQYVAMFYTELVCFGNTFEGITAMYTSCKNHLWSLASHVGLALIQYDLALASTSKTSGLDLGLEDPWPWP